MGAKWSRKIQWGAEGATTPGTAVAATGIARAVGVFDEDRTLARHAEDVNLINGTTDSYVTKLGGMISMTFDAANFEQICHILDCGIAEATATVDTGVGATGYIREYPFPTSSVAAPKTMTLEMGDESGFEEMEYSFVQRMTLEGSPTNAYSLTADWYGRQQAPTTVTGALTVPTVDEILFGKTKLYIDDATATIGTTPIDCTVLGLRLEIDFGLTPKYAANGQLYFCGLTRTGFVPRLTMTLEHNATSIAQKVVFRSNSPRAVKVLIEGDALGTAGTYTYKSFVFESRGYFESVSGMNENDGNDVIDFVFVGAYDRNAASFGQIIVVNELATLAGY
jgi:hypothetical protein